MVETDLSSAHVSLVVEPKLSQRVVPWQCLNQGHHTLSSHVVGLYVQTDDGRILLQHLSNSQSHGVISPCVCEAEDPHMCVGPQGFSESDQSFLRSKLEYQNYIKTFTICFKP